MAFVYSNRSVSQPQEQSAKQRLLPQQTESIAIASLSRLWWHTKAYGTILGVALLAIASMVFLHLHWLQRQTSQGLAESSPKDVESTS